MSGSGKGNAEKARYWQRTIREAARNGMSIREFCRWRRLRESQFYWWQRKLKAGRDARTGRRPNVNGKEATLHWSVTSLERATWGSSSC